MITKFKWCVAICKKVALTIQTATSIKRFIEEKGFGKWFDALFPLIKSRDSCQPEQAIEPSTSLSSSTSSTPVNSERRDDGDDDDEDNTGCEDTEEREPPQKKGRDMFVPIKKRKRKNNESESVSKVLKILETMVANDPTKELLQFMREDAERSRQNEMELLRILTSQGQNAPVMNQQETLAPQQVYYHAPQLWQHPDMTIVPQTPPSRHAFHHQPGNSSPFEQAKTYAKL